MIVYIECDDGVEFRIFVEYLDFCLFGIGVSECCEMGGLFFDMVEFEFECVVDGCFQIEDECVVEFLVFEMVGIGLEFEFIGIGLGGFVQVCVEWVCFCFELLVCDEEKICVLWFVQKFLFGGGEVVVVEGVDVDWQLFDCLIGVDQIWNFESVVVSVDGGCVLD